MKINALNMMLPHGPLLKPAAGNAASPQGFSETLMKALADVNQLHRTADASAEKLVLGEGDIHQVMLDTEKATLALQLTVQIRNKMVEAYQEVSRMQL